MKKAPLMCIQLLVFVFAIGCNSQRSDYDIRNFGASTRPGFNNRESIQAAINACHTSGGGTVNVPPGEYYTGMLELKSNVELKLEKGAVLRASPDEADYTSGEKQYRWLIISEYSDNITAGKE